jgi:hypothetical protein
MKWIQRFFCVTIFSLIVKLSCSQGEAGAPAAAMAGAFQSRESVWMMFHNPAGIAGGTKKIQAGIFGENRFLMKELSEQGFALSAGFGKSAIGLSYRSYGFDSFKESGATLSYAMTLSEKLRAAIQLRYLALSFGDVYGRSSLVSGSVGLLYDVTTKLSVGAHLEDPTRPYYSESSNVRRSVRYRITPAYRFSEKLYVAAEIRKTADTPVSLRFGMEYKFISSLAVRGGFIADTGAFTFGFGWMNKSVHIDAAAGYLPNLGFVPQMSLTYSLAKESVQK